MGEDTGDRAAHIMVFPLHSNMESRWNSWVAICLGSILERRPSCLLIELMILMAVVLQPPRVSTKRGRKVIPAS